MGLRSICAALLGTLMLSESAFALSCMRPDVVKTLEDAKASEKTYSILVGHFDRATPQPNLPGGLFKPKMPQITSMWFEGYALAKYRRQDGQLTRFRVDVETSCAGPWCSDVPQRQAELIAFVELREGQAPLLKISPCPYWTFPAERKQVKKLRQCFDKSCQPEAPDW